MLQPETTAQAAATQGVAASYGAADGCIVNKLASYLCFVFSFPEKIFSVIVQPVREVL